jgi:hypothetical protein
MRTTLLLSTLLSVIVVGGPAWAQLAPGSIGNGGRMPETMSPGALPPPPTISAPPARMAPPSASYGARYPNTESYSRDRIESQGYRVERITPQNNGSWKADASRDAVPTRPQGVPTKITIFPDGRVLEEHQP